MIKQTYKQERRTVLQWLSIQISLSAVFAVVAFFEASELLRSAALGAFLFILPNVYLTISTFRSPQAVTSEQFLYVFSRGQVSKWVITLSAFALAFRFYTDMHAIAFVVAYCFANVLHVAGSCVYASAFGRPSAAKNPNDSDF